MNITILKPYLKPSSLVRALRNPKAAWQLLRRTTADYGELGSAVGVTKSQFKHYMATIAQNGALNERIWSPVESWHDRLRQQGGGGYLARDLCVVIYALVRSLRPSIVVETGVASGTSSCYILAALEDNRYGQLSSIDLPCEEGKTYPAGHFAQGSPTPIPQGAQPGWIIPPELRGRWHLTLGRSSEVLPGLLKELGHIDIFMHDSEHSYENQTFEYETAWAYLRDGGLLLSDDIVANSAFPEFVKKAGSRSFEYGNRFGVIAKPAK